MIKEFLLSVFIFCIVQSSLLAQNDCPVFTKDFNAAKDSFRIAIDNNKSARLYSGVRETSCQFGYLPVAQGIKWGFYNLNSGKEITACIFDSVAPYKIILTAEEDTLYFAPVIYKGQEMLINSSGQFVFSALELSVYEKNKKKGLQYVSSDKSIKITITEPIYESLKVEDLTSSSVGYGLFIAEKEKKLGLVNVVGKEVLPFEYDKIFVPDMEINDMYCPFIKKGKKTGVCNKTGKILVPAEFETVKFYATTGILDDGTLRFAVGLDGKEGMYAVGKGLTFPCIYDEVFFIDSDGEGGELLVARIKKSIGLYPPPGSTKKADEGYDDILPLAEGIRLAKKNGKWGAVDAQSNVVVAFTHDLIKNVDYKYLWVMDKGKWGSIDKQGNYIIQPQYDDVMGQMADLITVELKRNMGLINSKGEAKTEFIYSRMSYNYDRKIWLVTTKNKDGILDEAGKVILAPEYEKIVEIFDDYIVVQKNNLLGIIDHKGKVIIDYKYSKISPLKNNKFSAIIKNKYGVIDSLGKTIIPFEFEDIYPGTGTNFVVQKERLKGLYDKDGKIIIPILYEKIIDFKDGFAKAVKEGKSIWVDANGKEYTENPSKKKRKRKQQEEPEKKKEKEKESEDDD